MNHWKQGHSDSILLLTSNERIDQGNILEEILEEMVGQIDIEEMMRRYGEEEAVRLIGKVVKNNEIIMKTQKQLKKLLVEVEKKNGRKIGKWKEEEKGNKKRQMDGWKNVGGKTRRKEKRRRSRRE